MPRSRHLRFTRAEWARLRADTPLTLSEDDLAGLRGLNDRVSLDEVVDIYLPLSRLLNLHVDASQGLYRATATFLGTNAAKAPYLVGLAGSVAVGKSTTARIMRALLARWPNHTRVDHAGPGSPDPGKGRRPFGAARPPAQAVRAAT